MRRVAWVRMAGFENSAARAVRRPMIPAGEALTMKRLAVVLLSLTLTAAAQTAPRNLHWAGSWATSPMRPGPSVVPPTSVFTNTTFREIVHLSTGGEYVRVRLSNVFGAGPMRVTSVHIAEPVSAASSQIEPGTDTVVTFFGKQGVTIPAGAAYVSDPVKFDAKPLSNLAVSFHIDAPPAPETYHDNSNATSYFAHGDQVSAAELANEVKVNHWYWLTGVEVGTPQQDRCVVAFGDSITDGWQSTVNGNNRWPDDLARRLQANPATRDVCVLNEGISGNRVLLDGTGPAAVRRLDRDVLSQPGVKYVVVLEAINDIGHLAGSGDKSQADVDTLVKHLEEGYQEIIDAAHARGLTVIGATLTPYGGSGYDKAGGPMYQAAWRKVNDWIRQPGHFDYVVHFNKVTADPSDPSRFAPSLDSGDHLHPNPAGYKVMADAFNLKWFEESSSR